MKGQTLVLSLAGATLLTLAAMVAVPAVALLGMRTPPLKPATPPLLQGVTAAGGWFSEGCRDPAAAKLFAGQPEAVSPNLTSRLATTFPTGSDADALQAALLAQGFRMKEPCGDDPAVHRAAFVQTGGGLSGGFPGRAVVAWRRTTTGQVAWVKGFVAYQGL